MPDDDRQDDRQDDQQTDDQDRQDDDPLAGLDDRARRIVEAANSEAAARRHELTEARQALADRERQLTELRQQQESDQERLVREAEERGATQRESELAPRILEADLAIAAAGRLRDPQDAVGLLSPAAREELLGIADTSARRSRAVTLIGELVEAKPYLGLEEKNDRQGPLVTQGGRSRQPSRVEGTPDDWLRGKARRS